MKRTLKILIILFLLDAVSAGGLWWGNMAMQNKKVEEDTLRHDLVVADQKSQNLMALKRTISGVEKAHEEMSKYLYDSSDESQINFVTQMDQLGSSTTGATIETTALDLSTDKNPVLTGTISVKGKWTQIYHFLRLIEEFPTHLVVTRFDVKGGTSGGEWSGTISFYIDSLRGNK